LDKKIKKIYLGIKDKIHKRLYLVVLIASMGTLLIPLIIFILYLIGDNLVVIINTSLTVGDALGFYGSILSFIGTVILGCVAIWQNNNANKNNKRLTDIEERRHTLELQPFVIMSDWRFYAENYIDIITSHMEKTNNKINIEIDNVNDESGNCACLSIDLVNTSNSYTMICYSGGEVYDGNTHMKSWANCITGLNNYKLYMNVGEKGTLVFYCDWKYMKEFIGKKIQLELILNNRYNEAYREIIDIWVISLQAESKNYYATLNPQNYRIEKIK
jgi:hypothetical protein